jgi:hypothetical protein
MATFWIDLRSLLRGLRFTVAVPRILCTLRRDGAEFLATYDGVIQPIVAKYVRAAVVRQRLIESLRSFAVKACFVLKAYTSMAKIPFLSELAVLGLSFTRLYDDLLDECDDGALAERLGLLFRAGAFLPNSDPERVLYQLYRRIEGLLARNADDTVFKAAAAVHEYQILSMRQQAPATPATLLEITRGKGGYGVVTLFALMRESMSSEEVALLLQLGEVVQLLDDYQDAELDFQNGVATMITEGILGLPDVFTILRRLQPEFRLFYGRQGAANFLAIFYLTTCISFLRRHWPTLGTSRRRRRAKGGASAMQVLLAPGDNLVQEATARSRPRPQRIGSCARL